MALIGIIYGVVPLLSFGIFFGYFANLFAVVVSLFLVVLLIARIPAGKAKKLFYTSWLGFLNGGFVILAWTIFFIVGDIPIAGK